MKFCRIIALFAALTGVVLAGNEYDLTTTETFGQSEYQPVKLISREVRTTAAKPQALLLTSSQLSLNIPSEGFYTVSIITLNGRKLYSRTFALASGDRSVQLDGFSAPAGMVLVDICGSGVRSVQKMAIHP